MEWDKQKQDPSASDQPEGHRGRTIKRSSCFETNPPCCWFDPVAVGASSGFDGVGFGHDAAVDFDGLG